MKKENVYQVPEIVEAGDAHKLIQVPIGPGKNHVFIFECTTCTEKAWAADPY